MHRHFDKPVPRNELSRDFLSHSLISPLPIHQENDQFDDSAPFANGKVIPKRSTTAIQAKQIDKPLPLLPIQGQHTQKEQVRPNERRAGSRQGARAQSSTFSSFIGIAKTVTRLSAFFRPHAKRSDPEVVQDNRPIYVDKGTQTSFEDLPKTVPSSPKYNNARARHSHHSRPDGRTSKSFSENSHRSRPSPLSSSISADDGIHKAKAADVNIESLQLDQKQTLAGRKTMVTDASMDTLGTYESRYSTDDVRSHRPNVSSKKLSQLSMSTMLAGPATANSQGHMTSKERSTKSKRSNETSDESWSSKSSTPKVQLQRSQASQSTTTSGVSPMTLDKPAPFYRVPVQDYFGAVLAQTNANDIPDHYKSSPLCPLNPKNKRSGGRGFCPLHGAPASSETDINESRNTNVNSKSVIWPFEEKVPAQPSSREKDLAQLLGMPAHSSDSPICPANDNDLGTSAICVIHGRAVLKGTDSEDSIPRASLRS